MIKKICCVLFIVFSMSACNSHKGMIDFTKPPSVDTRPPAGAHPIYQKGWVDGCESGLSAVIEKIQLFFRTHKYHYDVNLRYNNLYEKAWQYAYKHCAYSLKSVYSYKYL